MFFIKIGLLLFVFVLQLRYRKELAALILKIKLPVLVLYLLTAIPLIIFEEHINCSPDFCGKLVLPPTLLPLLLELLLVWLLIKIFKTQKILLPILIYSACGISYELLFGGLKNLPATNPFLYFLIIWTGIGYAFLAIIPVTIINLEKH